MRWILFWTALGSLACGKTARDPAPTPAAIGGEAGEPGLPRRPLANQAFAFGVAIPLDESDPSTAFACTSQGAFELGMSRLPYGRLSPDGLHWAVARPDDTVDIVEAPTLTTRRLAGSDVDVSTLRWSEDGKRLAYFAGGWPWLANGDGTGAAAIDFTLPDPDDEVELPQVEWAATGEKVGMLARGVATMARANGSVPRALTREAARVTIPWGLAFSHDASTAAVIRQYGRGLQLVDTSQLTVKSTEMYDTATIHGWTVGDEWVLVADPDSVAVLVSRSGEMRPLGGRAAASPSAPQVAISRDGISLLSLDTMTEVRLTDSALPSGSLFYRADGLALQYLDTSAVRVIALDGRQLAENPTWGLFGPQGWFAAASDGNLVLSSLEEPGVRITVPSSLPTKLAEGGGAWLADGRFALADEQGVHLIALDGTSDIVCSGVTHVDALQTPRANAY